MRLRLLGTAAGGGVPQWNCRCANCQAARQGLIAPLASCSLAFSPDGVGWYLINATPEITQQLARWPELHPPSGTRSTPLRGVLLTDGELDHVLGLLQLREGTRWTLFATPAVAKMLEEDLRLLPALRRYADVQVRALSLEEALRVGDGAPQVEVRVIETGRRLPRYLGAGETESHAAVVAVVLRDLATGRQAVYAPGVGRLSEALAQGVGGADVIFFDGTFWTDDELRRLGITQDAATEMGHVPVSGPHGSALWLAEVSARAKLYVHVNNTNPLLDPASSERAWIRSLGLELACEGWEVTL
jgi:pyrroloquinoline quinone biosynthesis protein B